MRTGMGFARLARVARRSVLWIGGCNLLAISLAAQCTQAVQVPSQTISSGTASYLDNTALKASGVVITGDAKVDFLAGNCIELAPEFRATQGSTFHAWPGARGDFGITAAPATQTIVKGGSAAYTITVNPTAGNSIVDLAAGSAPANASASLSVLTLLGPGAATLTVTTTASIAAGTYTATVTGTSGSFTHSTTVTLVVEGSVSYTFFQTDALTSINSATWAQAGAVTATAGGMTAPTTTGGSLISKQNVPDSSSDYEVRANITLAGSGGTYTLFARATPDARTGSAITGTFYAFEMQNVVVDPTTGVCSAALSFTNV